jgi:3-oxoadipate enol-lactonase
MSKAAPVSQIRTVTCGEARLVCQDTGQGQAILFLHGLGGNHASWFQQVAAFSTRYRCLALSQRGFAPSSPFAGPPSTDEYAADVACVLDQLGIDKAVIVAQSMGGWTASAFAERYPERVAGLLFSCTTGHYSFRQMSADVQAGIARWAEVSRQAAEVAVLQGIHVACGERMAREQPALHQLYRTIDAWGGACLDKEAMRRHLWDARDKDPHRLGRLTVPLLCLAGGLDTVIPPGAVMALAGYAAQGRALLLPDCGHSPYFEDAKAFNAALGDLLAQAGEW